MSWNFFRHINSVRGIPFSGPPPGLAGEEQPGPLPSLSFQPKGSCALAICPRCGGVHLLTRFLMTNFMVCGNPEDGEFEFELSDSLAKEALENYIKNLKGKNKKCILIKKEGRNEKSF